MGKTYRIGDLSRISGVNVETIRYYERIGLIAPPPRLPSGYRHYDDRAVRRLRFIRRGRELGFGIDEIRTLLQLAGHPEQPCDQADALARDHLQDVEARIADLEAMRDELSRLVDCHAETVGHCRLLEALDPDNDSLSA